MINKIIRLLCLFSIPLVMLACKSREKELPLLVTQDFNSIVDNKIVSLYTLTNANGITLQVTNWGCRVISMWVPDRLGNFCDIVLGYDNIDKYIKNKDNILFGSIVGRNAMNQTNENVVNESFETSRGFDKVVWNVNSVTDDQIEFYYFSEDGENGFPGNLMVRVTYILTDQDEFNILYKAVSDKDTPLRLSHHSYFNLSGEGNGNINNHIVNINSSRFVNLLSRISDKRSLMDVNGTPLDFRTAISIDDNIKKYGEERIDKCYNHDFRIDRKTLHTPEIAVSVYEPETGRMVEMWTTERFVRFATKGSIDEAIIGKGGKRYKAGEYFVINTQQYSDSVSSEIYPYAHLKHAEV